MPYGFNNDKSKYDLTDTVTGVKGDNEALFRTGEVNITKEHIGLANVDNTADASKTVANAKKVDGRTISAGTAAPSGGSNGDIYIQY